MSAGKIVMLGALVCLALVFGVGCSSSSSPSGPPSTGSTHTFTSSVDQAHSHTASLTKSQIETPPAAGISKSTSSSGGHTHTFSMTEAQLLSVKGGGSETITTSLASGHTHTFTITKWY